ncbi:MAG: patatin-like phospholipase family protein [Anaerolineales bacterium]|jgi:NTE family protein
MLAMVMSGGGNYGALEAGALEVLLEAGIRPGLWVGTSAGGLNAILMASDPTPQGVRVLQKLWHKARPVPQGGASIFTATRRFATGMESLFPIEPVAEFIASNLPKGCTTFGDVYDQTGERAFTLAVEYPAGLVRTFGERRDDRLLDGAMATSAMPPYFPPWKVGSRRYLDGGLAANLPLRVAVEYGASEILAMNIQGDFVMMEGSGIVNISGFALGAMIGQLTANQLEWTRQAGVRVHFLPLDAGSVRPWDFTQAENLIDRGRQLAQVFLADTGRRIPLGPTRRYSVRRLIGRQPTSKPW